MQITHHPIVRKTSKTCATDSSSLRCVSASADGQKSLETLFAECVPESGSTGLAAFIFSCRNIYRNSGIDGICSSTPSTCICEMESLHAETSSIQLLSLRGANAVGLKCAGRNIGFVFEDDHARYCFLSGILPGDIKATRKEQTLDVFKTLKSTLEENGFHFSNIFRTWFYLDKILDWYADFNAVRTAFFTDAGIFDATVPASTGIGAANPFGSALTCSALAVQSKDGRIIAKSVPSPLQEAAMNYRSSFSRAVEMEFANKHRALFVSGTASIDKKGKTVHVNDIEGQIALTMQVVQALLESRGMTWENAVRSIVYFKRPEFMQDYQRYISKNGIPCLNSIYGIVDICRDDLLFEIEIDAAI